MSKLHDVYHLTITTLSPLHIGTGNRLLRDYDFVVHGGKTWVIDQGVLAEMLYDAGGSRFDRMAAGAKASDLLRDADYDPASPVFRYVMRGEPRAKTSGSEIQEQIKDAWDRPYIPGSSLKGALRTALAFVLWKQTKQSLDIEELDDDARFAGRSMERRVLVPAKAEEGKEPNFDLLRVLQVGDSVPVDAKHMKLCIVRVTSNKKKGAPVNIEAIAENTIFSVTLTLDGFLRKHEVADEIKWDHKNHLRWLDVIPGIVNQYQAERLMLEEERHRWKGEEFGMLRSFFRKLTQKLEQMDTQREFILQLGWGGGWDSKTFHSVLRPDDKTFHRIVRRYNSAMNPQGVYKEGNDFPATRRLVIENNKPVMPLGWIHVKMEKAE